MKCSSERILTTHVGSPARADSLIPLLRLKEQGQPYDCEELARPVPDAETDVVRRQIAAGIDIVTDSEQGKTSFYGCAASALRFNDTRPSVAWLKFASLSEGARMASLELWH
jgi:5-methyltetrahydropteroyltriglutamate--homocysteine methyltransferase